MPMAQDDGCLGPRMMDASGPGCWMPRAQDAGGRIHVRDVDAYCLLPLRAKRCLSKGTAQQGRRPFFKVNCKDSPCLGHDKVQHRHQPPPALPRGRPEVSAPGRGNRPTAQPPVPPRRTWLTHRVTSAVSFTRYADESAHTEHVHAHTCECIPKTIGLLQAHLGACVRVCACVCACCVYMCVEIPSK